MKCSPLRSIAAPASAHRPPVLPITMRATLEESPVPSDVVTVAEIMSSTSKLPPGGCPESVPLFEAQPTRTIKLSARMPACTASGGPAPRSRFRVADGAGPGTESPVTGSVLERRRRVAAVVEVEVLAEHPVAHVALAERPDKEHQRTDPDDARHEEHRRGDEVTHTHKNQQHPHKQNHHKPTQKQTHTVGT